MAVRQTQRGRLVRAPRRKLVWARQFQTLTGVDGTEQAASLTGQFATDLGAQPIGATVARTLVSGRFDETAGVGAGVLFVGILVVGSQGASGPIDVAGRHDDWMYIRMLTPDPSTAGAAGAAGTFTIDLRSMRKLEEIDQDFQIVFQASGGSTWSVQFHANTLLMLH